MDSQPDYFQHALLGYLSDYDLMGVALGPHRRSYWQPGAEVASLDHSLWILQPNVDMSGWVFLEVEATQTGGGRGLVKGRFYDRGGKMIASLAQEGLMRLGEPGEAPGS